MTPEEILQDLEAYFETNWTTTDIAWQNVKFEAPEKKAWVRFNTILDTVNTVEIGTNGLGVRRGAVKVQIFTRKATGTRVGATYAGTIEALFHLLTVGDVKCEDAYTTGPVEEKVWVQHVVTCPFWAWVNE